MFTWAYTETVPTAATPDQIWRFWQDAPNWPTWDSELDWVRLDGPFTLGTKGQMKPSNGPEVAFELTEITPGVSFSDTARLPLTKMVFKHEYLPPQDNSPAHIRHSVTLSGLLAPVFARLVGRQVKAHLRGAMETLSSQAAGALTDMSELSHQPA